MPALGLTVVGVDVGARRSVMAVVGSRARLFSDLAIIYARQNDVSLIPLGAYDALMRAYVFSVEYPGFDRYRGEEFTGNIVSKALGAVVRAAHSVVRVHNELVGLVFEDLRQFGKHKRDLARARAVWELIVRRFGAVESRCPAVKVNWFWARYSGEVLMPVNDQLPIVLVEPEYSSATCPRCGNYLGRPRDRVTCSYCGFEGDRDVIGAINVAIRGFLILMKCAKEGLVRVAREPRAGPVGLVHPRQGVMHCVDHGPADGCCWPCVGLPMAVARRHYGYCV